MSKKKIRKALETALQVAMDARSIAWVMGTDKLDTKVGQAVQNYARGRCTWGEDHTTEVGQNARIERSGKFHVQVRTDAAKKEDWNDTVAGWVRDAYPVDEDLVREGIRVSILGVDDGDVVPDGAYLYSPVYVRFIVWRTN